ncbi:LysR family transcriptional regulator [Parathalassolituus penaei]|uniref:LysR family transcriptional regulator n=1 Tax=Parathalassolituus penaei TaxID=2997323 RepID=A0A9X3ITY6_9GAMM|nr:LysR family transcriptional regulator [Parathalassolituus penaei]MCY0966384.1 LysR family transcriptional regulator [Parathalassolituus penaei]
MLNLDLNLIRTFVVMYETRSTTLCAEKLCVTQPSVSYALGKLREIFNDRLFVRARGGMEPTELARQIFEDLSHSMAQIESTVENARGFVAAKSHRQFTIALTDLGEIVQLPLILARLQQQAPNISLKVVNVEIDQIKDWLYSSKVDAVICTAQIIDAKIKKRVIFQDHYVCLAAAGQQPMTIDLDGFCNAQHVQISRAVGHGIVEESLHELGIKRNIALFLPHFSALPYVLPNTSLLAVVPKSIAHLFCRNHDLAWCEMPVELPQAEISIYSSQRVDDYPAQRWFIDNVATALQDGW